MSHKRPPTRAHGGEEQVGSDGVLGAVRRHFSKWAGEYVEMRVDARQR